MASSAPRNGAAEEAVIRRYVAAMAAGDLGGVLSCFAPDGTVLSPVFGRMAVRPFYERLFADTLHVEVDDPIVYRSTTADDEWIARFGYRWERRAAPAMDTELIDLFRFDGEQIGELRIVIAGT